MPFSIKNNRKFLVVATSVVSFVAYWLCWPWPFAALRGQLATRMDLGVRNYKILAIGLPPPWREEYARLLRERYGIRVQTKALCIVSRSLVSYVTKYNEISAAAAKRRFGHDPFRECYEDAIRDWEQRQREKESAP